MIDAVIDADRAGALPERYAHIVLRADILSRGLRHLGIVGLIDEATGYQRIREERALATILENFIAEELRPWTRTFPPEFYQELFRLKGWPGPDGVKRPSVIGNYTNDIVYDRLAPGVLEELKRINPPVSPGRRRHKHHQWLTNDRGTPQTEGTPDRRLGTDACSTELGVLQADAGTILQENRRAVWVRSMTSTRFSVALAAASLAVAVSVSAEEVSEFDRFRLWNECKPLYLHVRNQDQEATKIRLTKEQLEIAARSRLRAARIYAAEVQSGPQLFLYVNVDIGKGGTFLVSLQLWKWLKDELRAIKGFWQATTWNTYAFGTYGQDPTTIVSLVSQLTDRFIDDYLRVNNSACKS